MRVALMHAAFKGVRLSGNIYAALKFSPHPLHIGLHARRFCKPKPQAVYRQGACCRSSTAKTRDIACFTKAVVNALYIHLADYAVSDMMTRLE